MTEIRAQSCRSEMRPHYGHRGFMQTRPKADVEMIIAEWQ